MKSFRGIVKGILLRALGVDPSDNLEGSIWHNGSDKRLKTYLEGEVREIVTDTQAQELENKTIDATKNAIINIPARDILYDPSISELNATNVQDAIDELKENITFNPTSVLYVDSNRQESYTELGTMIYPFKSIQAAIDAAPSVSIIKVQGGDYFENLVFSNKENIQLEGYSVIDAGGVGIYGNITINNGSTRIKLKSLSVYNNAGVALDVQDSLSRIYIQDTTFNGDVIFNDSNNWVVIDNCDINGKLTISHSGSEPSFTLFLNHHAGASIDIELDNPNASLIASQCYNLRSIEHTNGSLSLLGVNNIHADLISTSDTGLLKLDNVSFQKADLTYHIINKIGTCPYIISKTNRSVDSDVLMGTRASYAQPSKDIEFDNTQSGLTADNVQDAIDEVTATYGKVTSVNGMVGDVQLDAIDIPFDNTGTPIVSTDVQGALGELAAGSGGGKGVQTVDLYDPLSTVLPSGPTATIDGVELVDGHQVLFSNLNTDNNRVYEVSGVGTSIVFTPVEIFNGSFDPSLADLIVIKSGDLFKLQIAKFTSTTWDINDTFRQFNGVDYVETSSLKTVTLLDGQTTEVFSVEPSGSENFVIDASIERNGKKEITTLQLTTNGSDTTINNVSTSTNDLGITFDAEVDGGTHNFTQTDDGSYHNVATTTAIRLFAQSFELQNSGELNSIKLMLSKTGSPDFDISVAVYSDNSGLPGSLLGTSVNSIHVSEIATAIGQTLCAFNFSGLNLASMTKYWLIPTYTNINLFNNTNNLYIRTSVGYVYPSLLKAYSLDNGITWDIWNGLPSNFYFDIQYTEPGVGNLKLLATSTATGNNATMKFSYKRWSDLPGGPAAVPSYSGVTLELDAENIDYDNSSSGLAATNLQDAVDELAAGGGGGGGGDGANKNLSNLQSPTAINQHLVPNDTNKDLGSESLPFNNLYVNNIIENAHSQSIVNDSTVDLPGTEFGADYKSLEFQYYINRTGIMSTSPYDWVNDSNINISSVRSVLFGNGIFVAFLAPINGINDVAVSSDCLNWTVASSGLGTGTSVQGIAFGNGVFIRPSSTNLSIQRSIDGYIWEEVLLPVNRYSQHTSFVNGRFYIFGNATNLLTSTDGLDWQVITMTGASSLQQYFMEYINGTYVALNSSSSGNTYISSDAINWSNVGPRPVGGLTERLVAVAFSKLYMFSNTTAELYSTIDGVNWELEYNSPFNYNYIAYGNNTLILTGGSTTYVTSVDGENYYQESKSSINNPVEFVFGKGSFFLIALSQTQHSQIGTTENLFKDGQFKLYYDEFYDLYRAYAFENGGDNNVGIRFQVNNTTKMITMITDYIADQVSGNIRYKLVRKL